MKQTLAHFLFLTLLFGCNASGITVDAQKDERSDESSSSFEAIIDTDYGAKFYNRSDMANNVALKSIVDSEGNLFFVGYLFVHTL